MIVRPAPPEHRGWLAERARLTGPFDAIEALEGERIAGMVGFDGCTPNSVSMHVAVESPIALRRLVPVAFGIAFAQGRHVATALVLGDNARSLRLVRHLGFREVGRIRDGWARGVDMVVFEMQRRECRFLARNTRRSLGENGEKEAA